MQTQDTRELLQECDAGIKTAVNCIDAVIDRAESEQLRQALQTSRTEHVKLGSEIASMLDSGGFPGKDPNLISRMMSKTKIAAELTLSPTDATVAELMIDGCSMGVKKLSEYINRFPESADPALRVAERVVKTEQELMDAMRVYL